MKEWPNTGGAGMEQRRRGRSKGGSERGRERDEQGRSGKREERREKRKKKWKDGDGGKKEDDLVALVVLQEERISG